MFEFSIFLWGFINHYLQLMGIELCVFVCVRVRDLQSGSNGPPSSSWREVVSLTWQERIRETWQFQSRERNVPFPALTVNTRTITLFLLLALSPSVCVFVGITLHYSIFPENTNDITPTPLSFVCRFFLLNPPVLVTPEWGGSDFPLFLSGHPSQLLDPLNVGSSECVFQHVFCELVRKGCFRSSRTPFLRP